MLSDKSGFSLLELLVAVTIMGISFAVLTSGFGVNIRSLSVAEGYDTANYLLRKLYAETETAADMKQLASDGDFGEDYPEFRFKRDIRKEGEDLFYTAKLQVLFSRLGGERVVSADVVLPVPPPETTNNN